MDLEQAQTELRDKSKEARRKRATRNGSSPKKKQAPRARVSERTLLTWLAQNPNAKQVQLDAVKLLLQIGGKLPAEEPKNDPITPPATREFKGADLAPARSV
jgi:hypothetical protein